MKTQDLADILSHAPPERSPLGFSPVAIALSASSLGTILMTMGARADLMDSMIGGGFWFKTVFLATASVLSILMLVRSAYPAGRKSITPWLYGGLWAGLILGAVYQVATTAFGDVWVQWHSVTGMTCVGFVLLYGVIGQIVLIRLMRNYAPANLQEAGRNIALAAASAGAIGYSIHCNMDSPGYMIFAYGAPTLMLVLIGQFVLPRFIRW